MFNSPAQRRIHLHAEALPVDAQVLAFSGSEGISQLYHFTIELVSEQPDLPLQRLLGQPAYLAFDSHGVHGVLAEVRQGKVGRRLTHYHLTLAPQLHRLALRSNLRIFQQRSVAQIVGQLLDEHGILAPAWEFRLEQPYPLRDYCVQYGETDLVFIERLCQEVGIHYRFEHARDGHRVVFSDHQMHFPALARPLAFVPANGMHADGPVVSAFGARLCTAVSRVELRDHDFRKASAAVAYRRSSGEGADLLEHYTYPGNLLQTLDQARGRSLAQRTLERWRSDHYQAEGESDEPGLLSGQLLTLGDHPQRAWNQQWLVTCVEHRGHQPQVLEEQASGGDGDHYGNTFSAIPWDAIFRPELTRFKPRVPGSQAARVTGPEGEDVYCDAFGRVKVQFHWDREGTGNEHSSCWLRVASGWAGAEHGLVTLPRVGMAVLVSFLDDDPDQPVITGCLPDSLNMPPYALPEYKARSVLRSRSLGGSGGYNELSMDDRAGQELLYLRAQRNLEQRVERDSRLHVGRHHHGLVKGDHQLTVEAEDLRTVGGARKVLLRASDHLTVEHGSHTRVGTVLLQHAGQRVQVSADGEVLVQGGASITLRVGGEYLVVNAGGIFSSSPIQQGGAPATGMQAMPLLPGGEAQAPVPAALPLAPMMLALLRASKTADQNFCPLCQACAEGLCPAEGGRA